MIGYIIGGIIFLVLCIFGAGIRIVRPIEKGIVERFGDFTRIANPGFNWIIPLIDRMIFVNLTEQMMDVEPQDIITKDNLNARVDLQVYYKVRDDQESIKKSVYNVHDFTRQITNLAQTTARNEIGNMSFAEVNSSRNKLNIKLKTTLDEQSDSWGVAVVRVEMKEITPPEAVQDSMNRVIMAENTKDAAKDLAQAEETKADGLRRAAIKTAEGKKQAAILEAEGEAQAIRMVNKAAEETFLEKAQKLKQLEVTEKIMKDNQKTVIAQSGADVLNLVGGLEGQPIVPIKKR